MRVLLFVLLLFAVTDVYAQNPFRAPPSEAVSGDSATSEERPAAVETRRPTARRFPLSNELFALQRRLTGRLAGTFNGIKERARLTHVVVLLLVAFAYGAIHSLGPGHAKSLFVSYTLARPTTAVETWAAGGLFALTHTGMALVSFTILRQLLHQEQGRIEEYSRSMLRASGGLVVLAGVIVLIAPLLEGMAEAAVRRSLSKINKMGFLAVVAGLAPCPGAFLILVFSSVAGLLHIGIMAVVAVSLGMAITVSAFAHTGRGLGAVIRTRVSYRGWQRAGRVVRCAGGLAIVTLGLIMVFA